jgi:hypothetical protein
MKPTMVAAALALLMPAAAHAQAYNVIDAAGKEVGTMNGFDSMIADFGTKQKPQTMTMIFTRNGLFPDALFYYQDGSCSTQRFLDVGIDGGNVPVDGWFEGQASTGDTASQGQTVWASDPTAAPQQFTVGSYWEEGGPDCPQGQTACCIAGAPQTPPQNLSPALAVDTSFATDHPAPLCAEKNGQHKPCQ